MITNAQLLDHLCKTDFTAFLRRAFYELNPTKVLSDAPYLEAIAYRLEQVERAGGGRLMITIPPRYLKSLTISIAWVAWMLGNDPSLSFVCVSYANELSVTHGRDCRRLMLSAWYQRLFPQTRLVKTAEHELTTTQNGGRLSTSVGGALTGRGGAIIIIDDALKPEDAMSDTARKEVNAWFGSTLYSRLDNKTTGSIIVVMQRLHEDDLVGHLLEQDPTGWELLSLPAIAQVDEVVPLANGRVFTRKAGEVLDPSREDLASLERHRAVLGSPAFSAQYLQAPVPAEGRLIKMDWWRRNDRPPQRKPGDMIVQSWDCANKTGAANDFSVCVTALWRGRDVHILDVYRAKLEFPDLRRSALDLAKTHNAEVVLIEDAASGQQLLQELRKNAPADYRTRTISRQAASDKLSRMAAASVWVESGCVYLPTDANWLAEFLREVSAFPGGRHDDQADALAQLLNWLRGRTSDGPPIGPIEFSLSDPEEPEDDLDWDELSEIDNEFLGLTPSLN